MQQFLNLLAITSFLLFVTLGQTAAQLSFSKSRRNLKSGKEWVQLGNILSDDEDGLGGKGLSIASSSDGDIVAIGSPYKENNSGSVAVYKYVKEKSEWVMMGREMFGFEHNNFFGRQVALSYDGGILVVSSPRQMNGRGAVGVYRFDQPTSEWEKIGDDIKGDVEHEEFGYSIAVSEKGDFIAVGAPVASNSPGTVRVYRYEGNVDQQWKQIGPDLAGHQEGDEAGYAVDILSHGDDIFVAIGAPMDIYTEGTVGVYKFNSPFNDWIQLGQFVDGDEVGTDLGRSVSLAHDGTNLILAVGFPGPGIDKNSEIMSGAQVYSITPDGEWGFYGQMIFPAEKDDDTGFKVSLSHDAQTLAIGSPQYGESNGLVRVYRKNKENKLYEQIGVDLIGAPYDQLGSAVVMSRNGKAVTVGSPDSGYVVTYMVDGSPLNINSRSAMSIVMVTFLGVGMMALVSLITLKIMRCVKYRGVSFTSIPNNQTESSQMMSFPIQNNVVTPGSDDESDDEGSEVSYDDDDIDYETHLRKIT
jgi:hypothetical protein